MAAAIASLFGALLIPAAQAAALPTPACDASSCIWQFDEQAGTPESFQWHVDSRPSEVWLEVQAAAAPGLESAHWKAMLIDPNKTLTVSFESGSVMIQADAATALLAKPDPSYSFGYDQMSVRDLTREVAAGQPLASARIVQAFPPVPTSFTLRLGVSGVSAVADVKFNLPVYRLPRYAFAQLEPGGCIANDPQTTDQYNWTFDLRNCQGPAVTMILQPGGAHGDISGPPDAVSSNTLALPVSSADVVPSMSSSSSSSWTPSPTPTSTSTPTASAEPVLTPEPVVTPAPPAPETPAPITQAPAPILSPTTEPEATATAVPEPATEPNSKPEVAIAVGRNDSGPRPPAAKPLQPVEQAAEVVVVEPEEVLVGESARRGSESAAVDTAGTENEPGAATPLIAGIATTSAILAGVGGVQLVRKLRTRRLRIRRPQPAWPHT